MRFQNITTAMKKILVLALLILIIKTIASVRSLVDNKNIFLNKDAVSEDIDPVYLSEEDIDAIYVYDYLHTNESEGNFKKNNEKFAEYVGNVLRAETYNIAIKRVLTVNEDNVSLRLKKEKEGCYENENWFS